MIATTETAKIEYLNALAPRRIIKKQLEIDSRSSIRGKNCESLFIKSRE